MNDNFEPKIIAFLCNWCSYAGADLAGTSRIRYPPNIRAIRVMCSGRVDTALILKTLMNGADGILIAGCHPGDCHYQSGNYKTDRRIKLVKKLLTEMNIEPERVRFEYISASEGHRFAKIVTDFVDEIKRIGINPMKVDGEK